MTSIHYLNWNSKIAISIMMISSEAAFEIEFAKSIYVLSTIWWVCVPFLWTFKIGWMFSGEIYITKFVAHWINRNGKWMKNSIRMEINGEKKRVWDVKVLIFCWAVFFLSLCVCVCAHLFVTVFFSSFWSKSRAHCVFFTENFIFI